MKKIVSAILILFTGNLTIAQNAHFVTAGTIEFDKSVNMYALIKKRLGNDNSSLSAQAFDSYKKSQPQFAILKSTLNFSPGKSLFTPLAATASPNNYFGEDPLAGQANTVFNDLSQGNSVIQKIIFGESFLIKDSTRVINWKITDETREIAGYTCRRANALVLDSVYVVAFYTNQIQVATGPESFSGLPGMILGVALPHDNVTWFATKVTEKTVAAAAIAPPAKGKPLDNKGFLATLDGLMKNWGTYGKTMLKGILL